MEDSSKKRPWRRDPPVTNPYRDTLRQELGYKVDSRTAGCLMAALAAGLLITLGVTFVVYWLMH
jgi:hypothetical protein